MALPGELPFLAGIARPAGTRVHEQKSAYYSHTVTLVMRRVLGDRSRRAMAQDGLYDHGNSDDRPERHPRAGSPDAGPAASRTELAEPRTRTEYYEARRAADGETTRADEDQAGRFGWDAIEAGNRPDIDALRVTAAERDELLGLLQAMGMPTDPIGRLNVEG